MNCLNCNTDFEGQFCPNCGQRAGVSRIDFKTFTDSVISSLTDTNKGFLFNLKNLTLKPSDTVNGWLDGKRKQALNPISYIIIAVSVYLIVSSFFGVDFKSSKSLDENPDGSLFNYSFKTGYFVAKYIKYLFPLIAIYFAFFTKLFFKRRNLYEHIIINCFVVGQAIFLSLIAYPILKLPIMFNPLIYLLIIVFYFFVFKKYTSPIEILIGSLITMFLGVLLQFLIPLTVLYLIDLF